MQKFELSTLRVALCDKAILVEGPTDEMVVLYHFMKEYQCHPFAKGIELISVGGTVFKHFALLGAKLKKRIAVITDNDNLNIEKLETKGIYHKKKLLGYLRKKIHHYIH